jgi:hypothetical protein
MGRYSKFEVELVTREWKGQAYNDGCAEPIAMIQNPLDGNVAKKLGISTREGRGCDEA